MGEDSYSEYVYSRGSAFLYELRKSMGDGAFFHMLQEYYKAGFMKEVTMDDFVNAVKCFDDSEAVQEIINKYIE